MEERCHFFEDNGNFSEENSERLGWLFSKGTIKVHQERLQQLRCELLTILSSKTVSHSIKTQEGLERIETVTQKLYEQVQALDANVNASKQLTVQGFMATNQSVSLLQEQLGGGLRASRATDVVRMTLSTNIQDQTAVRIATVRAIEITMLYIHKPLASLIKLLGLLSLGTRPHQHILHSVSHPAGDARQEGASVRRTLFQLGLAGGP